MSQHLILFVYFFGNSLFGGDPQPKKIIFTLAVMCNELGIDLIRVWDDEFYVLLLVLIGVFIALTPSLFVELLFKVPENAVVCFVVREFFLGIVGCNPGLRVTAFSILAQPPSVPLGVTFLALDQPWEHVEGVAVIARHSPAGFPVHFLPVEFVEGSLAH